MKEKKQRWEYVGFVLPLVLAVVCLLSVTVSNHQAELPVPMPQTFAGEYSYDGEHWAPLTEETDLSALKEICACAAGFFRKCPRAGS